MEDPRSETEGKKQTLDAQLKQWGFDLEQFKARAEKAGEGARAEYEELARTLRVKLAEAQERLSELRKAGGAMSADMERGFEKAFAELKEAFKKAAARFR